VLPLVLASLPAACGQQASAPGKFEREVLVPPLASTRQACVVLDGAAAAYTARGAQEMTLWADNHPVAFTVTINSPEEAASTTAEVLNFHVSATTTAFDLQMPSRSYSSVILKLGQNELVLNARVSAGSPPQEIGRYVLFDMSGKALGSNTEMPVGERQDAVLHVELDKKLPRSAILGATVPPSRSEETVFSTIATAVPTMQGGESVATFDVPQGVPIERVQVEVNGNAEFRRRVVMEATSQGNTADSVSGTIQRTDSIHDGVRLQSAQDAFDAVLPDNQRQAMQVTVAIENDGQPPLPIHSIDLQMRERQLCFAASPGVQHWRLFYGAPSVKFVTLGGRARSLVERQDPILVTLGPEHLAANFHPLAPQGTREADRLLAAVVAFLILLAILITLFLRTVRIPHVRR
jgi:hypothetical protein